MINKLLPILLLVSCSTWKHPNREVSSISNSVSRILLLNQLQDKYDANKNESIKMKFRVYKFSMFTSKDQEVEIQNFKGHGDFDREIKYTDKKGIVTFEYFHKYKNGAVSFDVTVGSKSYAVSFEIYGLIERKKIEPIKISPVPIRPSVTKIEAPKIKLTNSINYEDSYMKVSNSTIIPSGVDNFEAEMLIKSKYEIKPRLELVNAKRTEIIRYKDKVYQTNIIPDVGASFVELKMFADDKLIDTKKIDLSFKPLADEINKDLSRSSMIGFNNVTYTVDDSKWIKGVRLGKHVGFSFANKAPSKSVALPCAPTAKGNSENCKPERTFDFEFKDQARQNMSLRVNDYVNEWLSQTMHSDFVFFPRKVVPHIKKNNNDTYTVILPTDEQVIFSSKFEIISGVLEEGALDNKSKNRFARKFPDIMYKGSGVVIRVNARGQTPSQGQFNNAKISGKFGNIGARSAMIYKYDQNEDRVIKCLRPKEELWEQGDINPIPFRFPDDDSFREYLQKHCNFSF